MKSEYNWNNPESLPEILPHSLNKHQIMDQYLRIYIEKLYSRYRDNLRINFVDGFSGGGLYKDPDTNEVHYGSPFIIKKAVYELNKYLPEKFKKEVKIQPNYYFVEKNKTNLETLKKHLNEYNFYNLDNENNHFINNSFEKSYNKIAEKVKSSGRKHRIIFILDQYGYMHVPMQIIQTIFKDFPQAEIILTFAVDWLIDYLSNQGDQIKQWKEKFEKLGFDIDPKDLIELKQESSFSRFLIQDLLSEEISLKCNANYYTRYFLQTIDKNYKKSHRYLWLLHMSNHPIARDEMMKVHWLSSNSTFTHAGYKGISENKYQSLGFNAGNANQDQLSLEFNFDKSAEDQAIETLMEQIPNIIWDKHTLTFEELLTIIFNDVPVTTTILKQVFDILLAQKDIIITSEDGTNRRKGTAMKLTDIIQAKNKQFF